MARKRTTARTRATAGKQSTARKRATASTSSTSRKRSTARKSTAGKSTARKERAPSREQSTARKTGTDRTSSPARKRAAARKPAMRRQASSADAALAELRTFGLRYPGASTRSPWPGHLDLVVKNKTFAFMSAEGEPFGLSCKLPDSARMALNQPHTQPTPYGLGRSGWVSASPPAGTPIPVELYKAWIDESYRAQAPKKLVAQLPPSASGPPESPARRQAEGRAARKRSTKPRRRARR